MLSRSHSPVVIPTVLGNDPKDRVRADTGIKQLKESIQPSFSSTNHHIPEPFLETTHQSPRWKEFTKQRMVTGHLNIKLSMLPGPGFGKSGQAVDGDNVDPVLNGEVWFGRGRHFRLHPGRVHRLLPNGHLSQSLRRDKKN